MAQILIKKQGDNEVWTDIYTAFGALPVRGFYDTLLSPLTPKAYITNESRLADGKSVVTAAPCVRWQDRTIELAFAVTEGKALDFAKYLCDPACGGMIEMRVDRLGKVFKLVYTQTSKYTFLNSKIGKFVVKFNEPNPGDRPTI